MVYDYDLLSMVVLVVMAVVFVLIFIWLLKVLFEALTKCWYDVTECPFIYFAHYSIIYHMLHI